MTAKATLGNLIGSWAEKCQLAPNMDYLSLNDLINEFISLPLSEKDTMGYSVYGVLKSCISNPNLSSSHADEISLKFFNNAEFSNVVTHHHRNLLALVWSKCENKKAQVLGFEYLFCETSSFIRPNVIQTLTDSPIKDPSTIKSLFILTIPKLREMFLEMSIKDIEYVLIRYNTIFSKEYEDKELIKSYNQVLNKLGPSPIYKSFKRDSHTDIDLSDQELETYLVMKEMSCKKFNEIDHEQIKKINNPFGLKPASLSEDEILKLKKLLETK